MNKRVVVIGVFAAVILAAAAGAWAQLRSGEACIYFKNGDSFIDEVVDISSARFVLQTAHNGEFPLRDIWMINYVDNQWNFPTERDQMATNEHYFFLKNGDILSGMVVDFSSAQKVYELNNGAKVSPARIRRIYFSKIVPTALANSGGGGDDQSAEATTPGTYRLSRFQSEVELSLGADGGARMIQTGSGISRVWEGSWGFKPGDKAIVIVALTDRANRRTRTTINFGRDRDYLIALAFDKSVFGNELHLQKR